MIRVLHVVGAMNLGGTETMLMNILREIDKDSYHFDFVKFSDKKAYYDDEILSYGSQVLITDNPKSINQMISLIKEYGPYDVVHAHTLLNCYVPIMASYICGVKIRISHAHTTKDEKSNFMRRMYYQLSKSLITHFSTNLLSCSKAAGSYLYGRKVYSPKYKHIKNVVNSSSMITKINRITSKEYDLVLGHIGRLVDSKNQIFLLKLLKTLIEKGINAKVILVGDGPMMSKVMSYSKENLLLDYVDFVGLTNDVSIYLNQMDVFVLPSKFEGLGLVLLEAQAMGIPCLTSKAIQNEADVGLGLVTQLSLESSLSSWIDKLLELKNYSRPDNQRIKDSFDRSGYSIKTAICELEKIYKVGD